jgi:hypothetical protein
MPTATVLLRREETLKALNRNAVFLDSYTYPYDKRVLSAHSNVRIELLTLGSNITILI